MVLSSLKVPADNSALSRGERTRSRVLEAAYDLFVRQGFNGTSVREIAQQAGMAVGGIYNHYASKEEIFAAVLDAYHPYHTVLPALDSAEGETVETYLRDAARKVRKALTGAETKLMPLVFTELVEFQGRHLQQIADRVMPSLMAFGSRFAQRRGSLRPIPMPVMLRTFIGLFISHLLSEMVLKGLPSLAQNDYDWFEGMLEIYLRGILSPEAETP